MAQPVIQVENLSKQYRLGQIGTGSIRDDVNRFLARIRGKEDPTLKIGGTNYLTNNPSQAGSRQSEYVWALKDISFSIEEGAAVGIIGKNGAGKSTLLKLLSKVTAPTTGSIKIRGRIASLLEVGTGFHPELSGRENVFLNGAIMGMTKPEIRSKFDEIVDFSGVEKYIDTPVKRYSSGMYVRLAFAVAAHLEPEILVVDEVLAVGDADFQKKCLGKMGDVVRGGRTVLFVSHNMEAISTLTDTCVVLHQGKIIYNGDTKTATHKYLTNLEAHQKLFFSAEPQKDVPQITSVKLKTTLPNNIQYSLEPFEVIIEVDTPRKLEKHDVSFTIYNEKGAAVLWIWNLDTDVAFGEIAGRHILTCKIPKLKLYKGYYYLDINFSEQRGHKNYINIKHVCPFQVVMYEKAFDFKWEDNNCVYFEDYSWEAQYLEKSNND